MSLEIRYVESEELKGLVEVLLRCFIWWFDFHSSPAGAGSRVGLSFNTSSTKEMITNIAV